MTQATQESPAVDSPRTDSKNLVPLHYQNLLRKITHMTPGPSRLIGVTSASRGEGVSTVCGNLAVAAARLRERPTLYIDTNLDAPSGKQIFGVSGASGLADILLGDATPECVQKTSVPQLSVVAAGKRDRRCGMVISSCGLKTLVNGFAERFEYILMDAPPISSADCSSVCSFLDGVVLVVEAERVRSQVIAKAKKQLEDCGARILGVVFNKRRNHVPGWLYRRL